MNVSHLVLVVALLSVTAVAGAVVTGADFSGATQQNGPTSDGPTADQTRTTTQTESPTQTGTPSLTGGTTATEAVTTDRGSSGTPTRTGNDDAESAGTASDSPDAESQTSTGGATQAETSTPEEATTPEGEPDDQVRGPPGTGPTYEYDMLVSDQWVHWWLKNGAVGLQQVESRGEPLLLVHEGHRAPSVPSHAPRGLEWESLLFDAPFGSAPPENFSWSPMPNRTYEYGLGISDGATREMLAEDAVRGLLSTWMCPADDPECDHGDRDAGVVFFVVDEEFAEDAPREIEGQPVRYAVVDPAPTPDE